VAAIGAGINCREDSLSFDDRNDGLFRSSPTGPRVAPPRQPTGQPPAPPPQFIGRRRPGWSVAIFVLLLSGIGIRAYRDLSHPEAWAYWKDLYLSPSMTASLVAEADVDGSGHVRRILAIRGKIGAASASWFRDRLDAAALAAGDIVVMTSPGGNLEQAMIMGELVRWRGLATAVAAVDAPGGLKPAYCASACVFVYAGGTNRYGVEGSLLGVHRFVAKAPERDPVAETQRTTGMVLSYMTRMGVSSAVVEAMTANRDVRWLEPEEAIAMKLVTVPVRGP
jgi:hypothetical protein